MLVLSRADAGRTWRLADICAACAALLPAASAVPELHRAPTISAAPRSTRPTPPLAEQGRTRVQETLTYLSATLPGTCSAAARLLAVQCALRAGRTGVVTMPQGLLRGMRISGHRAPWHELEDAAWLRCLRQATHSGIRAQLLDLNSLTQEPAAPGRRFAAHWALHSGPVAVAQAAPQAVKLAVLALNTLTSRGDGQADAEDLTRLCGLSTAQLTDVLDTLTRGGLLSSWHTDLGGSVHWRPA